MAGNIPTIDAPTVEAKPLQIPMASPTSAGYAVGQAISQVGGEVGSIAAHARQMTAAYDAQDRELKYGRANDELEQTFKNSVRDLDAADTESYQQRVTELRHKLTQDREALRAKYEGSLGDPLARKSYAIRTRLQTQSAERQAMLFADAKVRDWRKATSDQTVALNVEAAGNVSGDFDVDLGNLQEKRNLAHDAILLLHQDGEPRQVSEMKMRDADRKMAGNMLTAYDERSDHSTALAFLGSDLPDGTHVQFDPDKPTDPYLFTTAEAQKFVNHFKDAKAAKTGANAGAAWFFNGISNPEAQAKKEIAAGTLTAEEAGKAVDRFSSLMGHRFQAVEHSRTLATQGAAKAIVEYGGYEAAKAAGKIPANADVGSLLGVDAKFSTYATKPLMAKLDAVIGDANNAGWSLAVKREDLLANLYSANAPQAVINRYEKAYDKDVQMAAAAPKSPGFNVALGNLRDSARQVFRVSQITGKGLSDLKPWQRDALNAAEMILANRLAQMAPKTGAKSLDQADVIKVGSEVAKLIPDLGQRARKGENVVPSFPPVQAQPNDAQTAAGARVLGAFAGPAAKAGEAPEMTPEQYEAAPKGTLYRLPGSTKILVKQ